MSSAKNMQISCHFWVTKLEISISNPYESVAEPEFQCFSERFQTNKRTREQKN